MYSLEVYIKSFGGQKGGSLEPPRTPPAYGPANTTASFRVYVSCKDKFSSSFKLRNFFSCVANQLDAKSTTPMKLIHLTLGFEKSVTDILVRWVTQSMLFDLNRISLLLSDQRLHCNKQKTTENNSRGILYLFRNFVIVMHSLHSSAIVLRTLSEKEGEIERYVLHSLLQYTVGREQILNLGSV